MLITLLFFNYTLFSQDLDWIATAGGSGIDEGISMTQDINGNKYILGAFQDTVDFDPGPGISNLVSSSGQDIFIQKLDSNGNFIWAKQIGQPQSYLVCNSITTDNYGGLYITGQYRDSIDFDPGAGVFNLISLGNLNRDMFVLKLNTNGNFVWAKSIGGPGECEGYCIVTNDTGDVFIAGTYGDSIDFDPGPSTYNMYNNNGALFVQKLDSNGSFAWVKFIEGSSTWGKYVHSMVLDGENGLYVTGGFKGTLDFDPGAATFNLTSFGNWSVYAYKLTEAGNFLWAKKIGNPSGNVGYSITLDAAKNIYVAGYFKGTSDFDPGVGTYNLSSVGLSDAFLEKLDSNGNFLWATSLGGLADDYGEHVVIDSLGFVYTSGEFQDIIDIDPGPGISQLTSTGNFDIFLRKLDSSGNFIWGKAIGGIDRDQVYGLHVDDAYNIMITGMYSDTVDFDLGAGVTNAVSNGGLDNFTLKFNQDICSNFSIRYDSISDVTCIDSGYVRVQAIYGAPPYSYSWNTIPATNDSTLIISDEGAYTITVTDNNSCTATSSIYINSQYVNGAQNVVICPGDSIFLEGAYQTTIGTYLDTLQSAMVCDSIHATTVSFGDYYISRNRSICIGDSMLLAGSYQTTGATYIDTFQTVIEGCDSVVSTNLTIENNTPNFNYVDNGLGNYTFINTTGGLNQYHWSFGDGNTSTANSPSHTFSTNGTFVVVLAINIFNVPTPTPCVIYHIDTVVVTGVVSPLPCVAGYVMYEDTTNSDITVVNSSVGTNLTYFWSFGDGNTSPLQTPSHTYASSGPFYLCLTVDDGAGCIDMYCDSIGENGVVFKQTGFTINVISPPIISGLKNSFKSNSNVKIYPNPTSHQLTIDTELKVNKIIISDLTGKTIKTFIQNTNTLSIEDLTYGVYFIKLITDEQMIIKKFIKQ